MKQKKKIALVVDKDNWAFANIAKNIKENLSNYYEFTIIPMEYLDNNFVRLFLLVKEYDLIHFFWREHLMDMNNSFNEWYINELGGNKEDFKKEYIDYNKITTAVYDHLFLEDKKDVTIDIFKRVKNYYVSSNRLFKIYNNLNIKYKPKTYITDGVSLEEFYPQNLERFSNIKNRKIVIGWCGNSKWTDGTTDVKGLKTILEPAINNLKSKGYNIKELFADSQIKMIPHDKMINYYNKIDILVCASKIEGTPNPVLEAMACGVPVISTDVGIVPEVFGKKQKKYILKNRTIEDMEKTLKKLIDNEDEFNNLSKENLESIKKWTWMEVSKKFKIFFDSTLKETKNEK